MNKPRNFSLQEAKDLFTRLSGSINEDDKEEFYEFVLEKIGEGNKDEDGEEEKEEESNQQKSKKGNDKEEALKFIVEELRKRLPTDAQAPGEKIIIPNTDEYEGYTPNNTVHVDAFLYGTNEDVQELVDEGKLSYEYCCDCNGRNTKPLNFVSHSANITQLRFMFEKLLKKLDGKIVVDVGSRLGAVLYVGYFFSKANLIGIEMNKYFADLQVDMTSNFVKMSDRIINDDVMNQKEVMAKADVVVMNNVFEFFMETSIQQKIWDWMINVPLKKGCKIITIPSLKENFEKAWPNIDKKVIQGKLNSWVKEVKIQYPSVDDPEEQEDYEMIHMYEVK